MGTTARPVVPPTARTAILASADASFRQRVREALADLRWQVREAAGGAETLACLDAAPAETVVLDSWLPDLEIHEFVTEFKRIHPEVDLIMADASNGADSTFRGPRRNEVFHAIRRAQANDGTIWSNITANSPEHTLPGHEPLSEDRAVLLPCQTPVPVPSSGGIAADADGPAVIPAALACRLPEFVGSHPALLEVSRRIRLVAPRTTSVLIEGPTGSGKELVARALHRMSPRSLRKLIALNCAAIPEGLLEAELFGHTRGAFTGAVEGRMGRIEAAHGGTLFLDEIGDMPLGLQSKLLRFLESGELQRVGDNASIHVDVRIVAATHRPLAMLVAKGEFRADLYYRLAVFLIRTPALKGRTQDVELLTAHFLHKFAQDNPAKQITPECLVRLAAHSWPGNVRELEHVLERAWILAGERPRIDVADIELDEPE